MGNSAEMAGGNRQGAHRHRNSEADEETSEGQAFTGRPAEVTSDNTKRSWSDQFQSLASYVKEHKKWIIVCSLVVLLLIIIVAAVVASQSGADETKKIRADAWWKSGSIYSIFICSYAEAVTNSGYGNIKGLISKLPYIKEQGFDVIWISVTVDQAFSYPANEIENYTAIDSKNGVLTDFDLLLAKLKEKGMKIIMDLEINHSSDQHLWFLDSSTKEKGYEDLYIWHPGRGGSPPNNWVSVYGKSAWRFVTSRNGYFFHQFRDRTADFNYRNPAVLKMMEEVFEFWLKRGVDGIHIPNSEYLLEDTDLSDIDYNSPVRNRTKDRLKSYTDVVQPLRKAANSHGGTLFITADSSPDARIIRGSADAVFNRDLIRKLSDNSTCQDFVNVWQVMSNFYGKDSWPLWMSSTWDHSRLKSRLGSLADGIQVIQFLVRGTPITYYGEEIGMEDMDIDWENTQDPAAKEAGERDYRAFSRDPFRTPMQWNSAKYSGFTNNSDPYLAVNPNYQQLNVEQQLRSNTSLLHRIGRLNQLRKEFLEAEQTDPECRNNTLFFERDHRLVVLVNFGQPHRFHLGTIGLDMERVKKIELSTGASIGQDYVEFGKHGAVVLRRDVA